MAPRLRPDPAVLVAARNQDTVLLDTARGRYYTTNEVGGRIWSLLARHDSADTIAAELANEFDAPVERIRGDVVQFLDRMLAAGLVRAEEEARR